MTLKEKIMKELRIFFICEKRFIGKYIDIEIGRKRWAKSGKFIIVGEKWLRNSGGRKVHEQIVFYVHDNLLTEILGFKKRKIHYILSSWYDK